MTAYSQRLVVEDLRIVLTGSTIDVVDGISFAVDAGEVLGVVGESGSGKTTVALALLGHARRGLSIVRGSVGLDGRDILRMSARELRSLRGRKIAYVPQDPSSALDPAHRVGWQLREALTSHAGEDPDVPEARERMAQVLGEVQLAATRDILGSYPHQLSGGQQQRIALAMAFACRPSLIVLDEPTTGLDVATQRHVLDTIRGLCRSYGVAAVYVTHDLAVVAEVADRTVVMYGGRITEVGPTGSLFDSPAHPYTAGLLRAIPSPERSHVLVGMEGQPPSPGRRPRGCLFAPRCSKASPACSAAAPELIQVDGPGHQALCTRVREFEVIAPRSDASKAAGSAASRNERGRPLLVVKGLVAHYGQREILHNVDLSVPDRCCVAVVGESGSGKTTLARCIVGLHSEWAGSVQFADEQLKPKARERTLKSLRAIQFVFQNPYGSLNPRKTVGQLVEQPLAHFEKLSARARNERVVATLEAVALDGDFIGRYPDQLSGGERQRVAIARALMAGPKLLVCDEITSALDVSVQAAVVELLRRLQKQMGLSLLFITHNLALVRSIAQEVVVLHEGSVAEWGPSERVFAEPEDEYTVRLLQDVPKVSSAAGLG